MSSFGKQFRRLIATFQLKYSSVANATQYDASYISKWINSDILPSARSIPQICNAIANHIVTSCSEAQIADFCESNGISAQADTAEVSDYIVKLLMNAFQHDMSVRKLAEPESAAVSGDRVQTMRLNLQSISERSSTLNMIILGDLATLRVEDLLFLMDVISEVNTLPFTDGAIEILISTSSIENADDARTLVALINLLMIPTKVSMRVSRSPTQQTGLIVITDSLLYQAQCSTDTGWLLESFSVEAEMAKRKMRIVQKDILPTARSLYTKYEITPPVAAGGGANVYWNNRERQFLGRMDTLYCVPELQNRLFKTDSELAVACQRQHKLLLRMLDSGMEHQCILYREAMDDLVYRGIISIAGKESQISVMERLLYLQGLANLLDAYPNLNIRVIDGFVVDEIKHTTLPSLYLSRGFCGFLMFPENGVSAYCLAHSSRFHKLMDRMFSRLWDQNGVAHIDLRSFLGEYIGFCQDLLLLDDM